MRTFWNPFVGDVFNAVGKWKSDCLLGERSIFSEGQTWTPLHIQELQTHFVQAPILGQQRFIVCREKPHEPDRFCCKLFWFQQERQQAGPFQVRRRAQDPIPHLRFGKYIRFEDGGEPLEQWLARHRTSTKQSRNGDGY